MDEIGTILQLIKKDPVRLEILRCVRQLELLQWLREGSFECVASFGFESLFNLQLTHNPRRSKEVFENRINTKEWLANWPQLRVVS